MEPSAHHAPYGPVRQAGAQPIPSVVHLADAEDEATGDGSVTTVFLAFRPKQGSRAVPRERGVGGREVTVHGGPSRSRSAACRSSRWSTFRGRNGLAGTAASSEPG
jgi:hypothetical protein